MRAPMRCGLAALAAGLPAWARAAAEAASPAVQQAASGIPFRTAPDALGDGWRLLQALAVVAVFGLLAWAMWRWRQPVAPGGLRPAGRRLQVVERLRISPRSTLLLVELDGRSLLLGEQPGGLVLLSAAPAPAAPPSVEGHDAARP